MGGGAGVVYVVANGPTGGQVQRCEVLVRLGGNSLDLQLPYVCGGGGGGRGGWGGGGWGRGGGGGRGAMWCRHEVLH